MIVSSPHPMLSKNANAVKNLQRIRKINLKLNLNQSKSRLSSRDSRLNSEEKKQIGPPSSSNKEMMSSINFVSKEQNYDKYLPASVSAKLMTPNDKKMKKSIGNINKSNFFDNSFLNNGNGTASTNFNVFFSTPTGERNNSEVKKKMKEFKRQKNITSKDQPHNIFEKTVKSSTFNLIKAKVVPKVNSYTSLPRVHSIDDKENSENGSVSRTPQNQTFLQKPKLIKKDIEVINYSEKLELLLQKERQEYMENKNTSSEKIIVNREFDRNQKFENSE